MSLVLSIFPGIGILDRAFEEEGFCLVRGPDLLWGGDIATFSPPSGVFDGVIGGPPCQAFSALAALVRHNGYEPRFGNLIPEFERVVGEAKPHWFLMENVRSAPVPCVTGYLVSEHLLNNRYFGAEQNRVRRFSFGTQDGRPLTVDVALFEAPWKYVAVSSSDGGGVMRGRERSALKGDPRPTRREARASFAVTARHNGRLPRAVISGHGPLPGRVYVYTLEDACELQGLPRDFCDDMPFTKAAKLQVIANGVPLPMGLAVARAVKRALADG